MKDQRTKLLILVALLAALGAALSAFAAGSHCQIGFNDGAFNFDFKVATGDSRAATALGLIALAAFLAGLGFHFSQGGRVGGEAGPAPVAPGSPGVPELACALRRLTKSKRDVWLGGVCGGLGEHTPLPSWMWRLGFLLSLCAYGTGVLLYVLLWICLPEPLEEKEPTSSASGSADCTVQ